MQHPFRRLVLSVALALPFVARARDGRVFVDVSGAACTPRRLRTPQLAYDLLSRASEPQIREIFDNVIFILWPSINPVGQGAPPAGRRSRRDPFVGACDVGDRAVCSTDPD